MDVALPTLAPRPAAPHDWATDALPPIWSRWHAGPTRAGDDPVVVSFTEFTASRLRDLPAISRAGVRLSRGWFAMDGAIGLFLYTQPLAMRGGSISVWRSEADLWRFFNLPLHLEIVKRYRSRGSLRAVKWEAERFDRRAAQAQARRLLAT